MNREAERMMGLISRNSFQRLMALTGAFSILLAWSSSGFAAEGGSSLPQLDTTSFVPQLIWLAITFVALYLIMSRKALPRVASVLEERANRKADDLGEADRARKQSEKLEAAYQEMLREARAAAGKILRKSRADLHADMDARKDAMSEKLSKRISKAEAKIAGAKAETMKNLEEISVEVCQAIIKKLADQKVTKKAARSVVKDQLKALG